MDKCLPHTREVIGSCMWCGKKLCEKCMAHKEGRKYYCEQCFTQLNMTGKQKLPKPTTEPTLSKQNTKGENPWI